MSHTKLRVSIVLPVYNEADRIADCLRSIARQTVQPYEVIVVDNNSTDATARIAASFSFVKLIHEPRQGVVYARDTGFNTARGDIIGRLDGDSLLDPDWVAHVRSSFENPTLGAMTGSVRYREIAARRLIDRADLFWRRRMARLLGPEVALQGANMAVRRSSWLAVSSKVCHQTGFHEDFDLAIHLFLSGQRVVFDEHLTAVICYRQAGYKTGDFIRYIRSSPRTYLSHGHKSGRKMYQVVTFVALMYPIVSILNHGYDPETDRFSWIKLFGPTLPARVNPSTFIE